MQADAWEKQRNFEKNKSHNDALHIWYEKFSYTNG